MSTVISCRACGKKNRMPAGASGIPHCGSCHAALPWLVDADEGDFGAATKSALPVLVDLWAPWCGPCRMVAPAVEQAAIELAGRLKVVKVNVDKAPSVSARFGVQGIPTLLVLRDGSAIARQVGALPPDQLVRWVRGVVSSA